MGLLDTMLDKLMFWREDPSVDYEIDGCFTLPGAELDQPPAAEPGEDKADCD